MTKNPAQLPTIAITGTFDVKNYGDLLFPIIAAWRLAPHGIAIEAYSPAGCQTGWQDEMEVRPLSSILERVRGLSGFLIGGGNIIHARSAGLANYPGAMDRWAYAGLWAGITALAATENKPVLWNAPGVPATFDDDMLAHLVHPALSASEYVSVRDDWSRAIMKGHAELDIEVVPDTAAELARLWPHAGLEQTFTRMLNRRQANFTSKDRFFTIHIKRRSLIGIDSIALAALIDAFALQYAMTPILIAIGPCHGDDAMARDLSKLIMVPHITLDDPAGLKEIASTISHSSFYIGCSLHGYITACAYGVPGRIVALPSLPKHSGFLAHVGRPGDLAMDWTNALSLMPPIPSTSPLIPRTIFQALDGHWERIAREILNPQSGMAVQRAQFLRQFVQNGLRSEGWNWAIPGFHPA